jgi:hypothetical protein
MKENEVDRACNVHGKMRNAYRIFFGKFGESNNLET